MSAAFERVPGAVVTDGVLQHVGNPLAEQRALAAGTAVAPLGDRRVLAVSGEDRLSWLDSLASQALKGLAPGVGTELLILDPNGRVEHAASVVDDGETTWLIVDAGDADALLAWLMRMRFRLRVAPRDAGDEFAVMGGTAAAVSALSETPLVWRDPWPGVSAGGHGYATVVPHPGAERDWAEAIVSRSDEQRIAEAAASGDLALAGRTAVDALRIAAWRPRWSAEADERTLPHEVDWMRTAVHLSKGCYRGQETVAKVHNLGHPPRRLVALQLDGSDSVLPERGAAVRLEGAEPDAPPVGAVTSVALHYEEGPIALALVRRSTPIDATLLVDTPDGVVTAAQETVVPPEAGATASVPRLPRLGRRTAAQKPA
ncbi:folate-binding protein YgfZ [Microbacterium sp. RU33B]|uniref:CAF17-like 4Fe-4S cluster assembly/insertion protein YgfZ n=1 Tax=Microbacterium sp. RU33B TaxID=1907390 RepID=UPI0009591BCE|nr:folate-binding protein YgfZ [Microbacterium sp. RU33B]SIT69865.1 hypothetical protein SAMN05880545_0598 [Microbacterium sp. RU33B]